MAKPSQRNGQIVRTWEVLMQLEAGPKTLDELAGSVAGGVTTRTIRRDLEALEAAGFSIYDTADADDGRRRWALLTKGRTPVRLTEGTPEASTLMESLSRRRIVRAA